MICDVVLGLMFQSIKPVPVYHGAEIILTFDDNISATNTPCAILDPLFVTVMT